MSRASDIQTDVFCDRCLPKITGVPQGRSPPVLPMAVQNCKNHWEDNASRVWCPFGRVYSVDPGRHRRPEARDTSTFFLAAASRDVIDTQADMHVPMNSTDWRARKCQFELMAGRTWPNPEWSKRGRHTREYVLNKLWQIFVDDKPVRRKAMHTHTNAESKKCSRTP